MKILNILRFILLAGILDLAIASGASGRLSQYRAQRVPTHLRLFGFMNTTEAMVENYDLEMCTKNGGPSAHENHKKMWRQSQLCFFTVYQDVNNEYQADRRMNDSRIDRINSEWEKVCRRIPSFENCFKNVTESLKICLDPEKHENVNMIYNTMDSVMKFMCEDNAARLKDFMNYTVDFGSTCLRSKEQDIQECANNTILNYIRSTVSDGASIGGIGAIHLLEPDHNKCTIFEKFQRCSVEALNKCTPTKPAELANSVLNIVKKATTCDHVLKSEATATTVANFILLFTTVMAFSSRLA